MDEIKMILTRILLTVNKTIFHILIHYFTLQKSPSSPAGLCSCCLHSWALHRTPANIPPNHNTLIHTMLYTVQTRPNCNNNMNNSANNNILNNTAARNNSRLSHIRWP